MNVVVHKIVANSNVRTAEIALGGTRIDIEQNGDGGLISLRHGDDMSIYYFESGKTELLPVNQEPDSISDQEEPEDVVPEQ